MSLSGELAQHVLELAPDATVVVDFEGTIVFANAQVERTFGYAPHEVAGRSVDVLLPERFRANHAAHRARFGVQPKPRAMGEGLTLFGQHKSGREFPVEISLSPVRSDGGLLVVAAVRDATVRRETEQSLIEANRAKSRLLAAASHDLRQPVQTLTLLNQAALRYRGTKPELLKVLGQQQVALDTISQLLASVLDVSKLDSGIVKADIANRSINDVFDRLRSDFGPQAEAKGLALLIEPTPEAGRTDHELLRRVLGNLLSNAIRYTAKGRVHVHCQRTGGELLIIVRDSGVGIPGDQLDRVFEEFYQVDRGADRPEGLGLGLSIVKRLAALLEHPVGIESVVDQGTTFTLRLPRAALTTTTARNRRGRPKNRLKSRILIVDDDAAVADATRLLLGLEGFEVGVANCKSEALAHASAGAPDLIISDFHLRSSETGAEVVTEVRAWLGTDVPAIFVTGDTSKVARARVKLDNTTLLSKPTRVEELLSAIQRHLGTAQ